MTIFDEKRSTAEVARLEAEIEAERKRHIKEAILELLKENPREIYAAWREIVKQMGDDTDRAIGKRIRAQAVTLVLFVILGLAALGYYWAKHS